MTGVSKRATKAGSRLERCNEEGSLGSSSGPKIAYGLSSREMVWACKRCLGGTLVEPSLFLPGRLKSASGIRLLGSSAILLTGLSWLLLRSWNN